MHLPRSKCQVNGEKKKDLYSKTTALTEFTLPDIENNPINLLF